MPPRLRLAQAGPELSCAVLREFLGPVRFTRIAVGMKACLARAFGVP
jgi:hypothetical protein